MCDGFLAARGHVEALTVGQRARSSSALRRFGSRSFARLTAPAMNGETSRENPAGSPRFLSVIRVPPSRVSDQAYVVSIGNGPSAVRMTSRSSGWSSVTSYVYSSRLPRKRATKASLVPTAAGGGERHSTRSMFSYHSGALSGSAA